MGVGLPWARRIVCQNEVRFRRCLGGQPLRVTDGSRFSMPSFTKSKAILAKNSNYIPGGVASVNRIASPEITFVKAHGAYMWDADGNRYIDYHAAFAPHFLGHNDPHVTQAVHQVLQQGASLYGSGTTLLEGQLAEMLCTHVP